MSRRAKRIGLFGDFIGAGLIAGPVGVSAPVAALLDGVSNITGAYSSYRALLTSYTSGVYYGETLGRVSTLYDQSAAGQDLAQATDTIQPVIATVSGKPWMYFDGARYLEGPNLTNFIASSDGFMAVSFIAELINRGGGGQLGKQVVGDAAEGGNIVLKDSGTAGLVSVQFDGGYKVTPGTPMLMPTAVPLVATFRKDGSNLYSQLLGAPERSVACGVLTALAYALRLGGTGADKFQGHILEFVVCNVAPDATTRNTIVQGLMTAAGTPQPANTNSWPSAANTGTAGTLTSSVGDYTASVASATVSGLDITGSLFITANNVTISNCRITTSGGFVVHVADGVTGTIIEDCEIVGTGSYSTCVRCIGIVRRCNIHGGENGVVTAGPSTISENYIHDLAGAVDAHFDGIECNGGSDVTIFHNRISAPADQTSAININNYFAAIDNITIDSNYVTGGSYAIYTDNQFAGGPMTNVSLIDNVVGPGSAGYFSYGTSNLVRTGNSDALTGVYFD